MAGVTWWDDDSLDEEDASAPSCRRCLALMDELFPEPELDDQFGLAVQALAGTVAEHGYAEMWASPATSRPRSASRSGQRPGSAPATLSRRSPAGACSCSSARPSTSSTPPKGHARAPRPLEASSPGSPPGPCRRPGACSWDALAVGNDLIEAVPCPPAALRQGLQVTLPWIIAGAAIGLLAGPPIRAAVFARSTEAGQPPRSTCPACLAQILPGRWRCRSLRPSPGGAPPAAPGSAGTRWQPRPQPGSRSPSPPPARPQYGNWRHWPG